MELILSYISCISIISFYVFYVFLWISCANFLAEHPELLSTELEAQRKVSINARIFALGFSRQSAADFIGRHC